MTMKSVQRQRDKTAAVNLMRIAPDALVTDKPAKSATGLSARHEHQRHLTSRRT
jgi:hypothetical protein